MPEFTLVKREWLHGLTGIKAQREEYEQERALKNQLVETMASQLALEKETMKTGFSFEIKKGRQKSSTLVDDGTMMDEFDTGELTEDTVVKPEDLRKANAAMDRLVKLKNEMSKRKVKRMRPDKDDPTKMVEVEEPLFSDQELEDAIYTPLVRERVMPENFVPNKYSPTQRMIDATNDMYSAKLEEYSKEKSKAEDDIDKVEKVSGYMNRGLELGKKIAAVVGPEGKLAGDIITLVQLGVTTTSSAYASLRREDMVSFADDARTNMTKLLKGVLGAALPENKAAVDLAANAFSAASSAPVIAACLMKRPANIDKALLTLSDGLGSAFNAANANAKDSGVTISGAIVSQTFYQIVKGKNLAEAVKNGQYDKAIDAINQSAQGALKTGITIKTTLETEGKTKEEKAKIEKDNLALSERIGQGMNAASATLKVVSILADPMQRKNIGLMTETILLNVADALSNSLSAAGVPKGTAGKINSAFSASASTSAAVAYLCKDPPDKAKALALIGNGIEKALATCSDKPTFAIVGKSMSAAFLSASSGIDLAKAIKEGKYDEAATALSTIAEKVFATVLEGKAEVEKEGTDEDTSTAIDTDLQEKLTALKEQIGTSSLAEGLKEVLQDLNKPELEEEISKKVTAQQIAEAEETFPTEEDILYQLRMGEEKGTGDTRGIDNLIQEMMRDRMIMELATKLISTGVAIAAQFVPQLQAANKAVSFMINLRAAAQRALALQKWVQNNKDAVTDQSPYAPATKNFVKNQAEQFSHYSVQAALDLANTVASAIASSGEPHCAAGGMLASKILDVASVAEQLAYDLKREVDYQIAWATTKRAFKEPGNRKLAQLARQLNPTLAKYAMAYGAVVENDSIAKSCLSSCGLTERHLSKESGSEGCDKVVKFLEVNFPDDQIILERVRVKADWAPKEIKLEVKCWLTTITRAEREGDLLPAGTGRIDATLKHVQTFAIEFAKPNPLPKAKLDLGMESIVVLISELQAYYPKYGEDHPKPNFPHEEMGDVRSLFVAEAEKFKAQVEAKIQASTV